MAGERIRQLLNGHSIELFLSSFKTATFLTGWSGGIFSSRSRMAMRNRCSSSSFIDANVGPSQLFAVGGENAPELGTVANDPYLDQTA